MNLLLHKMLEGIEQGTLRVQGANNRSYAFGNGSAPVVAMRFTDAEAEWLLATDPALRLGELYMNGRLVLEQGDCYDLIAVFKLNMRRSATAPVMAMQALRYGQGLIRRRQDVSAARYNIAHHYDLDEKMYRLFLDDDMQYSCAYFEYPEQSLGAAQLAKKRHLASKMLLEPGQSVLDVGCGWGGLAMYLAEVCGVRATGVTLSKAQYDVACRRSRERGLDGRANFLLSDYRRVQGTFDRLVSVGMFEHIGLAELERYFESTARLLKKRGVFVLHSIGRTKPNPAYNPWLEKYIFPGSYIPALSEVLPAVERAGFVVSDLEILRLHYAKTLSHWRRNFLARRDDILAVYDERFLRMFEFYLAGSEAGFRIDRMFVFQLQLCRHQEVVPLTRDYVAQAEEKLRATEAAAGVRVD